MFPCMTQFLDSEDEDYNEDERELSWSESISRSTDERYIATLSGMVFTDWI